MLARFIIIVFLCVSGCQNLSRTTTPPPPTAPTITIQVAGNVNKPGRFEIAAKKVTLVEAITLAGGFNSTKNPLGKPIEQLVRLYRENMTYYISDTLIDTTNCGNIILTAGECVEVVAWTHTDLFRGVRTIQPLEMPKNKTNIMAIYEWVNSYENLYPMTPSRRKAYDGATTDFERAAALSLIVGKRSSVPTTQDEYNKLCASIIDSVSNTTSQYNPYIADQQYLANLYKDIPEKKSRTIEATFVSDTVQSAEEFKVTRDIKSFNAPILANSNTKTSQTDAVVVIERKVDKKDVTFILYRAKNTKDAKFAPALNRNQVAMIFAGDRVKLVIPEGIPIVLASLVAPALIR